MYVLICHDPPLTQKKTRKRGIATFDLCCRCSVPDRTLVAVGLGVGATGFSHAGRCWTSR